MMGRGEPREHNGILGRKAKLDKIEEKIERNLVLQISAGDADSQNRLAILEHQGGGERTSRSLSWFDTVWMPRSGVEASQAIPICPSDGSAID